MPLALARRPVETPAASLRRLPRFPRLQRAPQGQTRPHLRLLLRNFTLGESRIESRLLLLLLLLNLVVVVVANLARTKTGKSESLSLKDRASHRHRRATA